MKTCHVCGCEVDDRELICPDCGATVVKTTGALSLKTETPTHKSGNPIGKTIGSGSGYTDILRAEDDEQAEDDPFHGGSIPASMAKRFIEEEERKKKQKHGRMIKNIIKVVFFLALVVGAYFLVTRVFLKKDGMSNVDDALDAFVEGINEKDSAKLKKIMPVYEDQLDEAEWLLKTFEKVKITSNRILSHKDLERVELDHAQEDIKAEKNKMLYIQDGCVIRMEMRGTTVRTNGSDASFGGETEIRFYRIKGLWYIDTSSIEYSFFIPGYDN